VVKACPHCGRECRVYRCPHGRKMYDPVEMPVEVAERLRELTKGGGLSGKPVTAPAPLEFGPSCSELGIVAQQGKLIEVRAPDPDSDEAGATWPRIWLTANAARRLRDWLPEASRFAEGKGAA
jgi:hypothetical protein